MYFQLDCEQIDNLKATLGKIKILKNLEEYGFVFKDICVESDTNEEYGDIEQFTYDILTILNGCSTEGDCFYKEEAEELGVELMYDEDEISMTLTKMKQVDVVEYLAYHKSIGTHPKELVHFSEWACSLIDSDTGYWNDYEWKESFIGLDLNLYIMSTDVDFINMTFVENFMDMINYCKNANIKRKEFQRKIEERKQQQKRQHRGKKRRERIRIERLLIAA